MRSPSFCCAVVLVLGLTPAVLRADSEGSPKPKAQEAYLVRPSSQTVKQRQAVLALASSKEPSAGDQLIDALRDKDPMSRTLAVQGLGKLKDKAAAPQLSKILATDPYPEVRQAAAVSLRQIDVPGTVDALIAALKDASPNVRVTALSGLAHYSNIKATPFVEAVGHDPVVEVRRTAVFVLSRLQDPAAVPTLEGLLKDPDVSVRAGAAETLGELHSTSSKPVLLPLLKVPEKVVQASAAHALLMLNDSAGFEPAKGLMNDPDAAVSVIAIDALGWSKNPEAETDLQALLPQAPATLKPAIQEAILRTQQLKKQ